MKTRRSFALAIIAALAAQARPAAADDFDLDGAHASVIFGISHMGLSLTYGRFNKVSGSYSLDAADPAASKFQLSIAAESVDTNHEGRDNHLRGADFLNAAEFPLITFVSTKVAAIQEDGKTVYNVTGDLTLHGVKKEITLKLVKLGEGPGAGPQGGFRTGFLCDTHLMRSEFGMTNNIPAVGDEVAITISFEGVKK